MSYHIEDARGSFNELPERILVREDGYLGAYKFHGEPIVDYWYVPVERAERIESENAKLKELAKLMHRNISALQDTFDASLVYNGVELSAEYFETELRKLGIEVGE